MIRIAYCPAEPGYSEVGGKGLGVCKSWRDSFDNFKRDMGLANNRHLQRKDRARGFTPENSYWGASNG